MLRGTGLSKLVRKQPNPSGSLVFQVSLPLEVGRRLENEAFVQRRSTPNMITWIVEQYLKQEALLTEYESSNEVLLNDPLSPDTDW